MQHSSDRYCQLCETDISSYSEDSIYCVNCVDVIEESNTSYHSKLQSIITSFTSMFFSDKAPTEEKKTPRGKTSSRGKKPFPRTKGTPPKVTTPEKPQELLHVNCCVCQEPFTVTSSESWKTMCLSCYRIRRCTSCRADISSNPKYKNLCDNCYSTQLVRKQCERCHHDFLTDRAHIRNKYCGRSDCVQLTDEQKTRVFEKLKKDGYSKKELLWLEYICKKEGIVMMRQYIIITKLGPRKVDGYCEKNHTVYEFYGRYYHGHPTKEGVGVDGKTYKQLYDQTMKREELIREAGYPNIVSIWEDDYDELSQSRKG